MTTFDRPAYAALLSAGEACLHADDHANAVLQLEAALAVVAAASVSVPAPEAHSAAGVAYFALGLAADAEAAATEDGLLGLKLNVEAEALRDRLTAERATQEAAAAAALAARAAAGGVELDDPTVQVDPDSQAEKELSRKLRGEDYELALLQKRASEERDSLRGRRSAAQLEAKRLFTKSFRHCMRSDGADARHLSHRAEAALRVQRFSAAEAAAREAARLAPDEPDIQCSGCKNAAGRRQGEPSIPSTPSAEAKAEEACSGCLIGHVSASIAGRRSAAAMVRAWLAQECYAKGRHREAVRNYRTALELQQQPVAVETRVVPLDEAVRNYRTALELQQQPAAVETRVVPLDVVPRGVADEHRCAWFDGLGNALSSLAAEVRSEEECEQLMREADEAYSAALSIDETDGLALANRAQLRVRQGRWSEAEEDAAAAVASEPPASPASQAAGLVLATASASATAEAAMELFEEGKWERCARRMGQALQKVWPVATGSHEAAEAFEWLTVRAESLLLTNEAAAAREEFAKACELDPCYEALVNRGRGATACREFAEAAASFEKAAEIAGTELDREAAYVQAYSCDPQRFDLNTITQQQVEARQRVVVSRAGHPQEGKDGSVHSVHTNESGAHAKVAFRGGQQEWVSPADMSTYVKSVFVTVAKKNPAWSKQLYLQTLKLKVLADETYDLEILPTIVQLDCSCEHLVRLAAAFARDAGDDFEAARYLEQAETYFAGDDLEQQVDGITLMDVKSKLAQTYLLLPGRLADATAAAASSDVGTQALVKAHEFLEAENWQEALDTFALLSTFDRCSMNVPHIVSREGICCAKLGRHQKAVQHFSLAIAVDDELSAAEWYCLRSASYVALEQFEMAAEDAIRARSARVQGE